MAVLSEPSDIGGQLPDVRHVQVEDVEGKLRVTSIDAADTRACDEDGDAPARRPGRWRPVPTDFAERWPQVGWELACETWGCHSRVIARWLDLSGRDALVLARARYLDAERAVKARARRQRYVLGRTLAQVGRGTK